MKVLYPAALRLTTLLGCIVLGIGITFGASQLLWMESVDHRVNAYAHRLLAHSESVASNLTDALVELNKLQSAPCTDADVSNMKTITFMFRFIKDAGRISDRTILCSAMWGTPKKTYHLSDEGLLTKNKMRLWSDVPNYAIENSSIDISASKGAYVVTSPTAFSPYEEPPSDEYGAIIRSTNDQLVMREFGNPITLNNKFNQRIEKVCSTRFDICVTAQITSSVFTLARTGVLIFLVLLGGIIGAMFWYALMQRSVNRRTLTAKLTKAIRSDSIQLAYQPIVQASTGKLRGIEALARWHDKDLGHVPPDTFIRKAREINLSIEINLNILRKALNECQPLLISEPNLYVSINLSSECLTESNLMETLIVETQKTGIPCRQIAIEILEDSTIEMQSLDEAITNLRRQGYLVFIDDFGTGYSSLAYLSNLKIDKIKIDRSLTRLAGTRSPAETVLEKIHDIAVSMNTQIIFEGIETEEQRQAIISFSPDALAQGWLYSKAISLNELRAYHRH